MVTPEQALPGREESQQVPRAHLVLGTSLVDVPIGMEVAYVAMGCFWGAERIFYRLEGVHSTSVGYQGGFTPNPTYQEVCTGQTGHAETVKVVFDPRRLTYDAILQHFFESHDPTQGYRQGADVGTQYRSAIFVVNEEQHSSAQGMRDAYALRLRDAGFGNITTEILAAGSFYLAEEYHQQYLEANPKGYCGIGGTGISCPIGLDA